MNLMFISDIHGSEYWLDQALKVYKEGDFDRLIILGDLLYHGPRNPLPQGYNPQNVLVKLNALKEDIIAIQGNCDSEVDQMVLEFPILNKECHLLLDNQDFYLCHGHHLDEAQLPNIRQGTIICHGHTHIPRIDTVDSYTLFNPGSITLPKMSTPHSYGTYIDGELRVMDLEGHL